ncbi:hypothetical protein [Chitinophaga polysaccharea]|uniref:hypothetical protein n=1 Tax=Chitinophaga polysaccharea TaxID=1293035 RepID=UPI00115962D0|nr:hypothetical protein [Chitinophaga polysaccharea]
MHFFNFASSSVSTTRQDDVSRNGRDISRDGTKYPEAMDKSGGGYDTEIFTLLNSKPENADGPNNTF